ncbi:MAG: NYN domain-containing protein [Verrucomicrobia bacterium]|nr:NYN domain-containing protein [Verrucomicrobiota bacterium]
MKTHLAVYWDFENVHAAIYEQEHGANSYRKGRFGKQPDLVNVEAIMNYVLARGPVAVNRAYANWAWLTAYATDFQQYAVDLIQLFPRGSHAKNGADIRMAVDIIEDVNVLPHIHTVVIVGGDSDYIAVAQRLRQKGKEVIGIGVREATNRFWIASCNEFKYYDNLVRKSNPEASGPAKQIVAEADLGDAKKLLGMALSRVMELKSEPFARMSALKGTMLQLDPAFDEESYGYKNFAEFVAACSDTVIVKQGPHEKHVSPVPVAPSAVVVAEEPQSPLEYYRRILRKQQLKLLPGERFVPLCLGVEASAADGPYSSWDDFNERVKGRLVPELADLLADTDFTRLKQILFKCKAFIYGDEKKSIMLQPGLEGQGRLVVHVFREVISRLLGQPDLQWDARLVSELFFGDPAYAAMANGWYEEIKEGMAYNNGEKQPESPIPSFPTAGIDASGGAA